MVAPLRGKSALFFNALRRASSTAVAVTCYLLAEAECSFSMAVVGVILADGVALLFRALCTLCKGENDD